MTYYSFKVFDKDANGLYSDGCFFKTARQAARWLKKSLREQKKELECTLSLGRFEIVKYKYTSDKVTILWIKSADLIK